MLKKCLNGDKIKKKMHKMRKLYKWLLFMWNITNNIFKIIY